jgi:hypothetical protein
MKKGEKKAKQGTTDNSNCKLLFFSLPHMFEMFLPTGFTLANKFTSMTSTTRFLSNP